jgi:hypothetical protein
MGRSTALGRMPDRANHVDDRGHAVEVGGSCGGSVPGLRMPLDVASGSTRAAAAVCAFKFAAAVVFKMSHRKDLARSRAAAD